MHSIWHVLSWLGDSRFLLPMASVLIGIGLWHRKPWASPWSFGLMMTGLTTLATKIAFLGWGLGIARLDFTGLSGHAAMSAAVWPAACYVTMPDRSTAKWAAFFGLLFSTLIAYSRLPMNAHSWSEVAGGWSIGALASVTVVVASNAQSTYRLSTGMLPLSLAAGIGLSSALPNVHTHEMVVQLAKSLAGIAKEFDRSALWRG